MNRSRILFLLVLLFLANNLFCSDYIFKINFKLKEIECTDISINDSTIKFKSLAENLEKSVPLSEVFEIRFSGNDTSKILLPFFNIDTIQGSVDSINGENIYYRNENNYQKFLNKNEVICVLFNSFKNSLELELLKKTLLNIYLKENTFSNSKLSLRDGRLIEHVSLKWLKNDSMRISILYGENEYYETIHINNLNYHLRKGSSLNKIDFLKRLNKGNTSVRLKSGREGINLLGMSKDTIRFIAKFRGTLINSFAKREKVDAIFFYNSYIIDNLLTNKLLDESKKPSSSVKYKFKIDLNLGYGRYINNSSDDYIYNHLTDEGKKYADKLMYGLSIDANINYFINRFIGFGFKYNRFSNRNSYENILEETITTQYIGGNFLMNIPFKEGATYANISVGKIFLHDNLKVYNQSLNVNASTLGIIFSAGYDFTISHNLGIGIQSNLIIGKIKKINVEDNPLELETPGNLNRFDLCGGLRYFF